MDPRVHNNFVATHDAKNSCETTKLAPLMSVARIYRGRHRSMRECEYRRSSPHARPQYATRGRATAQVTAVARMGSRLVKPPLTARGAMAGNKLSFATASSTRGAFACKEDVRHSTAEQG